LVAEKFQKMSKMKLLSSFQFATLFAKQRCKLGFFVSVAHELGLQQVVRPSWPTRGMPLTAFTLQIGGYDKYQHCKLQAAQVTFTEPDSAVSAFEASSAILLKVCGLIPSPVT